MGSYGFYIAWEYNQRMQIRRAVIVAAGVVALFSCACGGIQTPSSNQTEQFSGTLQPKAANTQHNFNVSKTGEFTAKLTAWAPNSQIFAGLVLTLAAGDGSCTAARQQNNFVLLNAQAMLDQLVPGKYCIVIFDPGTLTAPQTYTITVSHS
jgi:hypothetical protein